MNDLALSARAAVIAEFEMTYQPGTDHIATAVDPQISPAGDRVAFTGRIVNDLALGAVTRICLAEGVRARQLIPGPGDQRLPRWSPDGSWIAFTSDAAEAGIPQLMLFDVRTGNSLTTPAIDGLVEGLDWSPDGRSILLVVAGRSADQGDTQGPGPAAADSLATSEARPSLRGPGTDGRLRQLWVYDIEKATSRPLPHPAHTVWEARWCGPAAVVAVWSEDWTEGSWFNTQLVVLDLASALPRVLHDGRLQLGVPASNSDGSKVAVLEGLCSDRGNVAGDIVLIEVATGRTSTVSTNGVDVTDLSWLDVSHLGFIGVNGLETVAGRADVLSEVEPEVLWRTEGGCGKHVAKASFTPSGHLAVVHESYSSYQAICIIADGTETLRCSLAPAAIETLRRTGGVAEAASWAAPDGTTIQGILCRPDTPGPFPLVVHVHGGPVDVTTHQWNMGNDTTRLLVGQGYAVLHPNPRGSYGRGREFVQCVLGDMGGRDTDDILSGVEAMIDRGIADPNRVGIAGTSYGGFMASLCPTRSTRFAAAVSMSPVTDWYSMFYTSNIPEFVELFIGTPPDADPTHEYRNRSPLNQHATNVTPTMNVAGLRDLCTPHEQAARFHNALTMRGVPSQLVTYPQEGHGVAAIGTMMDLCARVLSWFDRHMAPASHATE